MKTFFRSDSGYAFLLTLIFLPVFLGVSLLVIDVGRAHNAQQDLQAAADAIALAGAAELDGKADSRTRAKAAMATLSGTYANSVGFLGLPPAAGATTLQYGVDSAAPFRVTFLREIPASDDDVIDTKYLKDYAATTDNEARFVHVFARSNDLLTFFFSPATQRRSQVLIGATAVATQFRSTCDLAPVFMCNPYAAKDGKSPKDRLLENWGLGNLHARMVKLILDPDKAAPGPGNVGFLQTNSGRGANDLAGALAGDPYPVCIDYSDTVQPATTTQTGKKASTVVGFNTRFDIYSPNFGGAFQDTGAFPPANNVRKGWYDNKNGCVKNPTDDAVASANFQTAAIPDGPVFSDNKDPATDLAPGFDNLMRQGPWNFAEKVRDETGAYIFQSYWQTMYPLSGFPKIGFTDRTHVNYKTLLDTEFGGKEPSRYQVYQYELTHDKNGLPTSDLSKSLAATVSPGKETGRPQCYKKTIPTDTRDRRLMFVAVVDCNNPLYPTNGTKPVPVDALAEVFLVNPLKGSSKEPGSDSIDFEFVDISANSNGSIDKYLRRDIVLVR